MSKISTTLLLICSCLCGNVLSLPLPSYMKECRKGPGFNDCVVQVANAAIPTFVNGDPQYKLPSFNPLVIPKLTVSEDNKKGIAMNITLSDAKVFGFDKAVMTKSDFDFGKQVVSLDFTIPKLVIDSQYKVAGVFLTFPITGEGPGNIALDNLQLTVIVDFKVIKINGVDHMKLTNTKVKFDASKLQVELKNMFNGDAELTKNMNQALNANWRELMNAVGPTIAQEIAEIVVGAIDDMAELVPYDEILDEE